LFDFNRRLTGDSSSRKACGLTFQLQNSVISRYRFEDDHRKIMHKTYKDMLKAFKEGVEKIEEHYPSNQITEAMFIQFFTNFMYERSLKSTS
jgi:hypothetical protein